jgi:glutaminase
MAPPMPRSMQHLLDDVLVRCRDVTGGRVAGYIPELAHADPRRLAVATCTVDGELVSSGDAGERFTLQSVSKPFLYGLALAEHGREEVHRHVGVEPTGDTFDSLISLDPVTRRPHNPMVNAGALAIASLVQGRTPNDRFHRVLGLFRRLTGRTDLQADMAVYLSERASADRNRALLHLLRHFRGDAFDVEGTLDLYIQQCAILADTRDLAVMAATLASGGVNPRTGERVFPPEVAAHVRAVMLTCGMYDAAGWFAFEVGLPAKSGVSGGLIAVAPGRMGLAAWSPPLDEHGHSVRGLAAVRDLSAALRLHVLDPRRPPSGPPPSVRSLREACDDAITAAQGVSGAHVATYIPELARVDPSLLAVATCTVEGVEQAAGDAGYAFTLQSAAHPFAYGLALAARGEARVHEHVGLEPSGNPFHAIVLDPRTHRPFNPLVNAGALAVAALQPGVTPAERFARLAQGLAAFAGEPSLALDEAMHASEKATAHRNRAMAHLLRHFGIIGDEEAALAVYLWQCSVAVTCRQLARMAAALAAGGRHPVTGVEVLGADDVRRVLALMATCGMNEASGRFAFEVGLPAKSGISGAILAVAPGRYGAAVFSPPVDAQGNSVRGVAALRSLVVRLAVA